MLIVCKVDSNASESQLKGAYKKAAFKWHPGNAANGKLPSLANITTQTRTRRLKRLKHSKSSVVLTRYYLIRRNAKSTINMAKKDWSRVEGAVE